MTAQGEDDKNLNELLSTGADMSGSAIGGIIGFFMAGPFGAGIGGASGVAISKFLKSASLGMKDKFLGKREEKKIGATIIYAVEKIQENLKSKNIRNDNFFENDPNNRSSAEELFEATLIAAQRDPEESKLKYYGNLLGNIPFFQQVNRSQANHLIKTAQDLSWSQLCSPS